MLRDYIFLKLLFRDYNGLEGKNKKFIKQSLLFFSYVYSNRRLIYA